MNLEETYSGHGRNLSLPGSENKCDTMAFMSARGNLKAGIALLGASAGGGNDL